MFSFICYNFNLFSGKPKAPKIKVKRASKASETENKVI